MMSDEKKLVKYPKIILFGDSLTQNSFDPDNGKWGALLANKLQRNCDVVNRGFSGYNSTFCRAILPKLFSVDNISDIQAFVILLGSNDCSGSETSELPTVSLKEYKENLEAMIIYLQEIGLSNKKIILMTPPPYCDEKYSNFCEEIGRIKTSRNLKTLAQYASGCVDVANKCNIEVLNLYEEMLKNEKWRDYLLDGLHFASKGSEKVMELLWPLITQKVDITKMIVPYWRDFDIRSVLV